MNIYSIIRKNLSKKNRGRLTRFIYFMRLKPSVNKSKSVLDKGTIVFSADFEMAWAFRFSKTEVKNANQLGLRERENIPVFVELFEKYKIPITWATVGHLFIDSCESQDGLGHKKMIRPKYFENRNWKFDNGDWYDGDPCSNILKEPAWYASDLIDSILASSTKHEVGCHTFSHIDCTYENCTKELMDAELEESIIKANKKNVSLKSFVFPGGTFGNYESLVEKGFLTYRKPTKYHIDNPIIDKYGLVSLPSSLGLDKDPYNWSADFHIKIAKQFINKTIKSKKVCHFWFHPSMDKWYLEKVFPSILEMVANEREKGNIEVQTMGEIANKILKNGI